MPLFIFKQFLLAEHVLPYLLKALLRPLIKILFCPSLM